jgi:excinuclease ABC subunit C
MLFSCQAFTDFGPSRFDIAYTPLQRLTASRPSRLRVGVRRECQRRPGVYGMVNADRQLIYVGKAKSLRARLLSYFRPRSRNPKAGRILRETRTVVWEHVPSEFAALLRELELICRWRPRLNVQGQPGRRPRTFVCLGRKPAPYVFLSRCPAAGLTAFFGPILAGRKAREAVRRLNDHFQLRDCPSTQPMLFAEQAELFPVIRAAGCIRYELGTCLGPCIASCAARDYRHQVQQARAFLEGRDRSALEHLETNMTNAAAAQAYERAAILRDQHEVLAWLWGRLEYLRHLRDRHSFVYVVRGHDNAPTWYLIARGHVIAAAPPPAEAGAAKSWRALIERVSAQRKPHVQQLAVEELDAVLLVGAWFRRHPEERARTLQLAEALAACNRFS